MKSDFIHFLECQNCKSGFKVKDVYTKQGKDLINATIECQCSVYPVLGGIPIIKKPSPHEHISNNAYIMERLKIGKIDDAVALPFEGEKKDKTLLWLYVLLEETGMFKKSIYPLISLIRKLKKNNYKKYADNKLSFLELIDAVGWGTWGDYLKHRFSCSSFWPLYPFMSIMRERSDMVLDLLCGTGHASYVISQNAKPKKHVCADLNYSLLFMAKKYFVKDAEFICLDGNDPLPFKDNIFSSNLMIDSTHYVSNRVYLAKECERTLKSNGILFWLHLHNKLQKNTSEGYALSPSKWTALISRLETKVFPEDKLIEDYMLRQRLDLASDVPEIDINSSSSLCLIGTNENEIYAKYDEIEIPSFKSVKTPVINPIYNITSSSGGAQLVRTDVNDIYKNEYPLTFNYLPKKYTIKGNLSRYFEGSKLNIPADISLDDKKEIEKLLMKFIIIDVPKRYI
jgi:SAM-dependent methyltransferase